MATFSRRNCKNERNNFCYKYGEYTAKKKQYTINVHIRKLYAAYFDTKVEVTTWAPQYCCTSCSSRLSNLLNTGYPIPFGIPMIRREPQNHFNDCYFSCVNLSLIIIRTGNISYQNVQSASRPIPQSGSIPVPKKPDYLLEEIHTGANDTYDDLCIVHKDNDILPSSSDLNDDRAQLFSQLDLSNLIRNLMLTKDHSELLASRLKEKNLLQKGVRISLYRKRSQNVISFFQMENELCYCCDIDGLFQFFEQEHSSTEWRLFIDASKTSVKAVLLHIGNQLPSVPVVYSMITRETYKNLKDILNAIQYNKHQWMICADLKVVAIPTGLQAGYTKFCCSSCLWDSRARHSHYKERVWPKRDGFTVDLKNVANPLLVSPNKIILPPLHIKLGPLNNL